jgi:hypothetical protein
MRSIIIILSSIYITGCATHGWDRNDMFDAADKSALLMEDRKHCMLATKSSHRANLVSHYDSIDAGFSLNGGPLGDEELSVYDMDPYNEDNLLEAVSNPTQNSTLNTVADCIESRGWAWVPLDEMDTSAIASR